MRRSIFALSLFSTFAVALVQAQSRPPVGAPRTSPTQPVQGVAPRPAPKVAMMASVDPALFKGMKYRLVGPSRGGRVTTVTGVPSQPRTFYMGVASGGVFRTTDGGATWVPITDGKVPVASTGSIAVAATILVSTLVVRPARKSSTHCSKLYPLTPLLTTPAW